MQEASPLNLSTNSPSGLLILTVANNTNNNSSGFFISQQLTSGRLPAAASKIGIGAGAFAHLPSAIVAQSGHSVYVAEIYYKNNVPAPLQKLIRINVTNQFYDVAYFPGS
jgi:hypothetical protein